MVKREGGARDFDAGRVAFSTQDTWLRVYTPGVSLRVDRSKNTTEQLQASPKLRLSGTGKMLQGLTGENATRTERRRHDMFCSEV